MAIEYVGGRVQGIEGATSGTSSVSLSGLVGGLASSPSSDDYVVVTVVRVTFNTDKAISITGATASDTLRESFVNDYWGLNIKSQGFIMGATPPASLTVNATGSSANAQVVMVQVWRGVDLSQRMDVAAVSSTTLDTTAPNLGSITPASSGAMIGCVGGGVAEVANGSNLFSQGGDLDYFLTGFGDDTADAIGGMGHKAWTSGAFDPAAWSYLGADSGDYAGVGVTYALKPAGDGTQTLTPSLFTNSNSFYAPTVTGGAVYAGPTWVGKSTAAGSTAATSINFTSSGRASGDKLFIAIATANQAITAPSGFTEVATYSPQSRGTAAAAGGLRLGLFEKESNGTETTVSIADSGNHQYAVGTVHRKASGSIVAIEAGDGNNVAAATSCTFGGVTTSVDDCQIVTFVATDRDSAGPSFSAEANASLANLTERHDAGTGASRGSGIAIYTGEKLAAGATGNTTATQAASAAYCWITLALKNDTGGATQTLTPSLFTNTGTIYSPTVIVGTADLTPSLFTNSNTIYSPTVEPGAAELTPSLFANDNTFYAPTVEAGAVTLAPSLLTNANSFYAATVTVGAVTLEPSLVTNTNVFYAASVDVETVGQTLSPPLVSNGNIFYLPSVLVGAVTLAPGLLTNTNTFYAPAVSPGAVVLTPPLIVSENVFYAASISSSAIQPPFLVNISIFYSPLVVAYGAKEVWIASEARDGSANVTGSARDGAITIVSSSRNGSTSIASSERDGDVLVVGAAR